MNIIKQCLETPSLQDVVMRQWDPTSNVVETGSLLNDLVSIDGFMTFASGNYLQFVRKLVMKMGFYLSLDHEELIVPFFSLVLENRLLDCICDHAAFILGYYSCTNYDKIHSIIKTSRGYKLNFKEFAWLFQMMYWSCKKRGIAECYVLMFAIEKRFYRDSRKIMDENSRYYYYNYCYAIHKVFTNYEHPNILDHDDTEACEYLDQYIFDPRKNHETKICILKGYVLFNRPLTATVTAIIEKIITKRLSIEAQKEIRSVY